jgi:hypothetical protein
MKRQSGLSLLSVMLVGFVLVMLTVLTMKVAPEYIEYYGILQNINAVAADPTLRDANVSSVRLSYAKRAEINQTKSVTYQDLVVAKDGGVWRISFAYSKTIPLFANVSLLLDFEGSSSSR